MEPEAIPLPEPALLKWYGPPGREYQEKYYTADQVRAAVLAERERCARVCEEHARITWDDEEGALACAAAIRSGTAPAQEASAAKQPSEPAASHAHRPRS